MGRPGEGAPTSAYAESSHRRSLVAWTASSAALAATTLLRGIDPPRSLVMTSRSSGPARRVTGETQRRRRSTAGRVVSAFPVVLIALATLFLAVVVAISIPPLVHPDTP